MLIGDEDVCGRKRCGVAVASPLMAQTVGKSDRGSRRQDCPIWSLLDNSDENRERAVVASKKRLRYLGSADSRSQCNRLWLCQSLRYDLFRTP